MPKKEETAEDHVQYLTDVSAYADNTQGEKHP